MPPASVRWPTHRDVKSPRNASRAPIRHRSRRERAAEAATASKANRRRSRQHSPEAADFDLAPSALFEPLSRTLWLRCGNFPALPERAAFLSCGRPGEIR
jgi:hypothetical protein